MKIIIVGAGLSGLSVYHALRKHLTPSSDSVSIKLVDARDNPCAQKQGTTDSLKVGGALSLAPNGLRALSSIAPKAFQYLQLHGFPSPEKTFRNAQGESLGVFKYGTKQRYGFETLMVPRSAVYAALAPDSDADVHWGRTVLKVGEGEKGLAEVTYGDGTTERADLVIGADGAQSVVRAGIMGNAGKAKYDGLTGVGGFIPISSLSPRLRDSLALHDETITVGKKGIFGYSMCSPSHAPPSDVDGDIELKPASSSGPFIQWWSVYESPTPLPSTGFDVEAIKAQLLSRHGDWKSPYDDRGTDLEKKSHSNSFTGVYRQIIELGCPSDPGEKHIERKLTTTPRYFIPQLTHWSNLASSTAPSEAKGRIVLVGDAAYTIAPEIGQNASCAIEDAVVYALLLQHFQSQVPLVPNANPSTVYEETARAYEALRMPRLQKVLEINQGNGCVNKEFGWLTQKLRDFALRMLCHAPESMHDCFFTYDAGVAVGDYLKSGRGSRCAY